MLNIIFALAFQHPHTQNIFTQQNTPPVHA
jgi:hypothetical protein